MTTPKNKIEVTPELTRQLATRRALGASLRDLAAEFGFSPPVVNRILRTDLAQEIQKGVIDDAVKGAIVAVRRRLADMTELAMQALEHQLKENSMEAVKTYFKVLGMDAEVKQPGQEKQAAVWQVILPGAQAPKEIKDIEVESG